MSRVSKRSTSDHEQLKKQRKKSTTTKTESPCGRKPAAINAGDITLTFLENDSQKHGKYRLRVTWPEVTLDIDGFPVSTIDRYIVHLQHSDDGTNWDSDFRRKVVEAKDGDTNTTAKAIFKGITRKRYYRVRVRSKDSGGCKSDLSAWTTGQRAGGSDTVPSVGTISRTRVGPRRIEFDWDDVNHPDFDRYKVTVLKADTETGTFAQHGTIKYVRNSRIAVHVDDTDKTRWWKVRVRAQLVQNPDGTRDESSSDTDSTADQANDLASGGGPSVAPSIPTGVVTKRRLKAVLVRWDDVQDDATQEPVKYRVYASSSSIASTPGFNPAATTKAGEVLITRFWNGSSWVDFNKSHAGTTFYFRVQGKNAVGTSALSTQVTGSPKKKLSSNPETDTFSTDDPDVVDVVANRFIADDGTGDKIVISDTSTTKAQIKFVTGGGGTCTFAVKSGGNVSVTGGHVDFSAGGLLVPNASKTTSGQNGEIWYNGKLWYWRGGTSGATGGTIWKITGA